MNFNNIIYSNSNSNHRQRNTHQNRNNFFFRYNNRLMSYPSREPVLNIPLETLSYNDISANAENSINEEMNRLHNQLNTIYREYDSSTQQHIYEYDNYINNIYADYITSLQDTIQQSREYTNRYFELEQQIIDNEINSLMNEMDTIIDKNLIQERIKKNIEFKTYHENIIKNDVCPILYTPFESKDNICIFKKCNHGIDKSMLEKFIDKFDICPLCKTKLY